MVSLRRLELAVVLPGLPRLPLVTRRVVLRRVRGLLPGCFLLAARPALVLAGIILRLPRLVFGPRLPPVARLRPRLVLRAVLLPVAPLRVLARLTLILAVRHLVILLGAKSPEGAPNAPPP